MITDNNFNKWANIFFYLSMCMYPMSLIMNTAFQKIGFSLLAGKTIYLFYAVLYIFIFALLMQFKIPIKRIICLYSIYLLYVILYITSHESAKKHFMETRMTMIYTLYLPYAVLILSQITDFSLLFKSRVIEYTNHFIIVGAFLAKYLFHNETGYMSYSYSLLPIWLLFSFNYIHKPTLLKTAVALVMLLEGLIFGARGPLIWLVVGGFFYLILDLAEKKLLRHFTLKRIVQVAVGVAVGIGAFSLFGKILSSISTEGSYIINRINQGILGESTGRSSMIDVALSYLKQMGGDINGIFYDRSIMPEGVYVHNFILETYLNFGWVLGSAILLSLAYYIMSTFYKASLFNKKVVVFVVSAFFLKYFVSGSMYEDFSFIVMLSILFSIRHNSLTTHEISAKDIES